LVAASLATLSTGAEAQFRLEPSDASFWIGVGGLLVGSAIVDENLRNYIAGHQHQSLDHLADSVDPLGRARYLVPTMVAAFVVTRVARKRRVSDAVLRIGLGYAAADAIGSVLKPTVGRHRPEGTRTSLRFRPFSAGSVWHSFPSAHTVHAFALAAGVAEEVENPWVAAMAYGTATLVGLQRVYTESHWVSDMVGSAAIAIVASKSVIRWMHARQSTGASGNDVRVLLLPGVVFVDISSVLR
jgi:membrane-associated phospholipid phosphatase